MKYLVLVYGNEKIWGDPSVDFAAMVGEVDAFNAALRESGEMVAVEGLVAAPQAVRNSGGIPVVTDGPYLEAKEHIGGILVVSAPDLAGALEWARRAAAATTLPIEVQAFQDATPR